jgi:hypothetical protein
MAVGLVALGLFMSGCYGPFYLTRKVWKFNGEVSDNRWVVEVAFLVMNIIPIYSVAGMADSLIFNSLEFWTGNNPMAEASANGVRATRRIVRGDTEYLLKRVAGTAGDELLIEQSRHGQPGDSLRFQRQGDHMVALNGEGTMLFSSRTEADGRVVISDAAGQQVVSYTDEETQRFLKSVGRF